MQPAPPPQHLQVMMATLCLCVLGGCLVQLSIASEMARPSRPPLRINARWRGVQPNRQNASSAAAAVLRLAAPAAHAAPLQQLRDGEEGALFLRFFRLLVMAAEANAAAY